MNVSQIRSYLECPQRCYYTYVQKRIPRKKSPALSLGSAWHIAMQVLLEGGSVEAALAKVDESKFITIDIARDWNTLCLALRSWKTPPDWTIIATEVELSRLYGTRLPGKIDGRLDAIVQWNGSYWHLQHKTVAPSTSIPAYIAHMQRDWHENIYQYLAENSGYKPYGGTILNICKKLSLNIMHSNPGSALSLHYIPRSAISVDKAVSDFVILNTRMHVEFLTPEYIIQNRSSCTGKFGNSICPYFGVCEKTIDLADNNYFVDAEVRHEYGTGPPLASGPSPDPILP